MGDYEDIKNHKNYGCLGCKHCHSIIIDGDACGYTCTRLERTFAPYPLKSQMVYGYSLLIKMDGTVEAQMFEKPPKCKEEKNG